jgi:hypothetical protein
MFNLISIVFGAIALALEIPAMLPLLGWLNWIVLPLAVVGTGFGMISNGNAGRNFCLVVFAIALVRLMLGGGIF